MPVSGAMDVFSLELANLLVGNDPGDACLETTISGPELEFTSATRIAITGADMDPHLNGQTIPMNSAVDVRPGDRLVFRGLRSGCRTYIAFAGGIVVPPVMGSRSTYLRAAIGGFKGRALIQGDELPIGTDNALNQGYKLPTGDAGTLLPNGKLPSGKTGGTHVSKRSLRASSLSTNMNRQSGSSPVPRCTVLNLPVYAVSYLLSTL